MTIFFPGDFILVRGKAWYSRMISIGELIRYRHDPAREYQFTHAALIVSTDGHLVEALGGGVERTHISKYDPADYEVFSIRPALEGQCDDITRWRVVDFALHQVGTRYDYLDIASISLSLLTGGKITVATDNRFICSELVARALERTNAIFPHAPQDMMPADLAKFFR